MKLSPHTSEPNGNYKIPSMHIKGGFGMHYFTIEKLLLGTIGSG